MREASLRAQENWRGGDVTFFSNRLSPPPLPPLAQSYYRGAVGAMLVYDTTFGSSFDKIGYWLDELEKHCPEAVVMLVGNKTDLADIRAVSIERGLGFAKEHSLLFVEASAKSATGVEDAFVQLLSTIHSQSNLRSMAQETRSSTKDSLSFRKGVTIKLSSDEKEMVRGNSKKRGGGCC